MPRRTRITDDDRALFRSAVADAKPLPESDAPQRPRPKPHARFTQADERAVLDELVAAMPDGELETGDELNWRANGVQDSVMRKLRRGHWRIEGELDLHGSTALEAKQDIALFIQRARGAGLGCVRIIHGKGRGSRAGRPILKQLVGGWLRRRDDILAYTSARPSDGGTGALVVLLRNTK